MRFVASVMLSLLINVFICINALYKSPLILVLLFLLVSTSTAAFLQIVQSAIQQKAELHGHIKTVTVMRIFVCLFFASLWSVKSLYRHKRQQPEAYHNNSSLLLFSQENKIRLKIDLVYLCEVLSIFGHITFPFNNT